MKGGWKMFTSFFYSGWRIEMKWERRELAMCYEDCKSFQDSPDLSMFYLLFFVFAKKSCEQLYFVIQNDIRDLYLELSKWFFGFWGMFAVECLCTQMYSVNISIVCVISIFCSFRRKIHKKQRARRGQKLRK